jgi:hypothetical protein
MSDCNYKTDLLLLVNFKQKMGLAYKQRRKYSPDRGLKMVKGIDSWVVAFQTSYS